MRKLLGILSILISEVAIAGQGGNLGPFKVYVKMHTAQSTSQPDSPIIKAENVTTGAAYQSESKKLPLLVLPPGHYRFTAVNSACKILNNVIPVSQAGVLNLTSVCIEGTQGGRAHRDYSPAILLN